MGGCVCGGVVSVTGGMSVAAEGRGGGDRLLHE